MLYEYVHLTKYVNSFEDNVNSKVLDYGLKTKKDKPPMGAVYLLTN